MEFDFCVYVSVSFCGLLMLGVDYFGYVFVEVSEEEEFEGEA